MTALTVADVVSALAFRDNRDPIVLHHRDADGRWAGTWDLVVDDTSDDTVTASLYAFDSDTALAIVQLQVSVMPCEVGPSVTESLESTSAFYAENPRTPAGPGGVDDLAGVARPRPVGDLGTVYWAGDVYPAVRSRVDGETYAAFYLHRPDDWHFTTLAFTERGEDECIDAWCLRAEPADQCRDCARAALPDRDEVRGR